MPDFLDSLIASAPDEPARTPATTRNGYGPALDVARFLADAGLVTRGSPVPADGGTRWRFDACPKCNVAGGNAWIWQHAEGGLTADCFEKCGFTWQWLRAKYPAAFTAQKPPRQRRRYEARRNGTKPEPSNDKEVASDAAPDADGDARGVSATGKYPNTDSGNGELFAVLNATDLRYDHRRGKWLRWAGHWYESDADGLAVRRGKDLARHRLKLAADIEDEKDHKAAVAWAVQSESRTRIEATVALARNFDPLADAGDNWDTDPWLLGVANGVVDMRTGALRDGQPADRILLHSPVNYDPAAQCPRWQLFLSEIFGGSKEMVDFVQRAIGYSLTGDTREQVLFILYGSGANGKGILLNTLSRVCGRYGHNLPFSSLEAGRQYAIPTDLADLVGKRFVTSSESNESAKLNEARVKALTGQDPITARFLHQDFFTFIPGAKFWLAVNFKPKVQDDSHGFWRRVRLLPFDQTFVLDHPPAPTCTDHRHGDPKLAEKLWQERAGILAWAVQGALEWQRRGLEAPAAVKQATEAYREEADTLRQFVADVCVTRPEAYTQARPLYLVYRAWAELNGMKPTEIFSSTLFGRRMADRYEKIHTEHGSIYRGIGLLDLAVRA